MEISGLGGRLIRILEAAGIKSLAEIADWSSERLSGIPGMGSGSVKLILAKIADLEDISVHDRTKEDRLLETGADVQALSYDGSIASLGLSTRVRKALIASGMTTVEDIIDVRFEELASIPGIGTKSADDIYLKVEDVLKRPSSTFGRRTQEDNEKIAAYRSAIHRLEGELNKLLRKKNLPNRLR